MVHIESAIYKLQTVLVWIH